MIEFDSESLSSPKANPIARIKVLGIGGGGSNMVNSMINSGFDNVTFIVANTDAQALKVSKAPHKIQLGVKSTKGLGAGANPEVGRRSAEEDLDRIIDSVRDADIVFLTGGLGGGTGSGGLPVIARSLKEKDILTVAVITKPFSFEGKRRMKIAEESLDLLKREVDTIIVLPNQKLIDIIEQKVSLMEAFSMVNDILNQFVRAVSDIIDKPGHINVDFADVKAIMKQKGFAIIGTGRASGQDRAIQAATYAISSPLLENIDIAGARGILFNIAGSSDLGLHELSAAASLVYKKAHEEANIVVGSVIDDNLEDEVLVTVIATGFAQNEATVQTCSEEVKMALKQEQESNIQQQNLNNQNVNNQDLNNYEQDKPEPTVEIKKVELKPDAQPIDLNDLDIPAVMRKLVRENQL